MSKQKGSAVSVECRRRTIGRLGTTDLPFFELLPQSSLLLGIPVESLLITLVIIYTSGFLTDFDGLEIRCQRHHSEPFIPASYMLPPLDFIFSFLVVGGVPLVPDT